jgi:hypothetical protein
MSFKLEFETDNAAFEEGDCPEVEIVRILRDVAATVADLDGTKSGNVVDSNGNTVGSWSLS